MTNMDSHDQELIKRFTQGDEIAFEKLVKRYLKPIYNFIFQIVRDKQTAEDLTQDTFLKAWKKFSYFNKNKNFRVWLFTIARNTAFDSIRKKRPFLFSFFSEGSKNKIEEIKDESSQPEKLIDEKISQNKLEKALEKVPEKYRAILILYYKEEFSIPEIAKILDKPYNTVKSQHLRAIKLLRKIFPYS